MTSPTPEPSQSTEARCSRCKGVKIVPLFADGEADSFMGEYRTCPDCLGTGRARPEPPVEGALEAAREQAHVALEELIAHGTILVEEDWIGSILDKIGPIYIAAARSGHESIK